MNRSCLAQWYDFNSKNNIQMTTANVAVIFKSGVNFETFIGFTRFQTSSYSFLAFNSVFFDHDYLPYVRV